jgi:hypothetical protein
MESGGERVCGRCGSSEETGRLETCSICHRLYCADCAHRAGYGRTFCSPQCGRAYYFTGETDDDSDAEYEE